MHNISIDGIGNIIPGEYGKIDIDGIGSCDGDLKAERINIDGKFKCHGSIFAQRMECDGIATFDGNIEVGQLEIDGKFKCFGALRGGRMECDGMAEFAGNVEVGEMEIDGMLIISEGNQIDAQRIECDGCLTIDGQINADRIRAEGIIKAREIVGDSIEIDSNPGLIMSLFQKRLSRVELIEATTVRLSGVTAQTVNGENVIIGPNCQIENLDCSGTLQIDPSSQVRNITGSAAGR